MTLCVVLTFFSEGEGRIRIDGGGRIAWACILGRRPGCAGGQRTNGQNHREIVGPRNGGSHSPRVRRRLSWCGKEAYIYLLCVQKRAKDVLDRPEIGVSRRRGVQLSSQVPILSLFAGARTQPCPLPVSRAAKSARGLVAHFFISYRRLSRQDISASIPKWPMRGHSNVRRSFS